MKAIVEKKGAFVTVEAAIVVAAVLLFILTGLAVLIHIYSRVTDFCIYLEKEAQIFADSGQGEILRIIKVIADTGGKIVDEIFQNG